MRTTLVITLFATLATAPVHAAGPPSQLGRYLLKGKARSITERFKTWAAVPKLIRQRGRETVKLNGKSMTLHEAFRRVKKDNQVTENRALTATFAAAVMATIAAVVALNQPASANVFEEQLVQALSYAIGLAGAGSGILTAMIGKSLHQSVKKARATLLHKTSGWVKDAVDPSVLSHYGQYL